MRGWRKESVQEVLAGLGEGGEGAEGVKGLLGWKGGGSGVEIYPGALPWDLVSGGGE